MRHTVPFLLLCVAVLSHNVLSQQPIGSKKVVKTPPPASPTQATPSPTPPPPQKQQVVAEAWDGADMPYYRGYDYRGEEDNVITSRHAAHPPHVSDYDQQQQHAADEQTEQQRYRQREAQQAAEGERKKQADIALARYISQQQQQAKYEDLELKSARQPIQDQHDSYQQHTPDCKEKEDHCPTPQQADDVKQAYVSHGTFSWRVLAKETEERRVAQAKLMRQAGADPDLEQQQGKSRAHRISQSVLQQIANLKQQKQQKQEPAAQTSNSAGTETGSSDSAGAKQQGQQQQEQQEGGKVDVQSTEKASDAESKSVSVAAVDDMDYLLPTSPDETGYGYNGVRAKYLPSDQAIAVGPHPVDPDSVMVIQGAQGSFEVNMVVVEDGTTVPSVTNNRVYMDDMMEKAGVNTDNLYGFNPSAWYDPKEKRYVLMWASGIVVDKETNGSDKKIRAPESFDSANPLFMAVSATNNPMGSWHVWALDTVPQVAPGFKFCAGQSLMEYAANTPQGTFTDDAVIVALGVYCGNFEGADENRAFLSVVFAYSKKAIYTKPPEDGCNIYAATYFPATSWYRSVPPSGQALVEAKFKPFNNYVQPARPQDYDDVMKRPMLVMKVSDTMISIATLTGESLDQMNSIANAPKILATLVGKGGDFRNGHGPDGVPVMPQPGTFRTLDAGDVGTMDRTHELRIYWATHHNGQVYLTSSEYWGTGTVRMPSIYWAVVKPAPGLCSVTRLDWGVVASAEGLAAAYPVIAARTDGRAAVAFAYSGAGTISGGKYPANPGVAAVCVGQGDGYNSKPDDEIQIVKRGPGVIIRDDLSDPQFWGTYSAASVWGKKMWFSIVIPEEVDASSGTELKHGSWVSAVDL